MTITLSPEVEADIRELLRLWGVEPHEWTMEAVARGALQRGVRESIDLHIEIAAYRAKLMGDRPQSVPDARVFEEPLPSAMGWSGHYHQSNRAGKSMATESPDIAEGTQVRTTGGKVLTWRHGPDGRAQWVMEGGAK